METRLFWIGMGMGAWVWATQSLRRNGSLRRRVFHDGWHALFWAGAAFSFGLVMSLSLETRGDGGALGAVRSGPLLPWALAALAGGYSFWSARFRLGKQKEHAQLIPEDLEWGETIFSAVLLAAFLMYFVLQAFKIPSGSMRASLLEGDHLFVNKFLYGVRVPLTGVRLLRLRPVHRGDIVVFEFPADDPGELHCGSPQQGKDFIKRVVGLPGDVVEVRNGNLLVNGNPQEEPYAQYVDARRSPGPPQRPDAETYQRLWQTRRLDKTFGDDVKDVFGPVTVPEGSYMMMGDNRDRSCDSRFWGPVQDRYVKGRAWFIYWPLGRMRGLT